MDRLPADDLRRQNRDLWRAVFHDDEVFLSHYFIRTFRPESTFYRAAGGRLQCAMQSLDFTLRFGGEDLPIAYVSGLATRPDCRRQGLAGDVLRESHLAQFHRGRVLSLLIPADAEAARFYRRRGYGAVARRLPGEASPASEPASFCGIVHTEAWMRDVRQYLTEAGVEPVLPSHRFVAPEEDDPQPYAMIRLLDVPRLLRLASLPPMDFNLADDELPANAGFYSLRPGRPLRHDPEPRPEAPWLPLPALAHRLFRPTPPTVEWMLD